MKLQPYKANDHLRYLVVNLDEWTFTSEHRPIGGQRQSVHHPAGDVLASHNLLETSVQHCEKNAQMAKRSKSGCLRWGVFDRDTGEQLWPAEGGGK